MVLGHSRPKIGSHAINATKSAILRQFKAVFTQKKYLTLALPYKKSHSCAGAAFL
jgi:hypothetical protein